jgi:hypothetical protein
MSASQHWDVQSNRNEAIARIQPVQHAAQSSGALVVVCTCTSGTPVDEDIAAAATAAAIEYFELARRNNSTTRALNETVRRVLDLARRRRLIAKQPVVDTHLHIVCAVTEGDNLCVARANTGAIMLMRNGVLTRLELGAQADTHNVVVREFRLKPGDRVLFATQSLINRLHERQLGNILKKHLTARNAAYALLTAAAAHETQDSIVAGVIDHSGTTAQDGAQTSDGLLQSIGSQVRLRPIPALLSLAFLLGYGGLMLGLIAGVRLPRIISGVSEAQGAPAAAALTVTVTSGITPTILPTADFAALGWLTATLDSPAQPAIDPALSTTTANPTLAPTETPLPAPTQTAVPQVPDTPAPSPTATKAPPTPTASPEPTWTPAPPTAIPTLAPTRVRPTRTPLPPPPTETPLPPPTDTPQPPAPQPQPPAPQPQPPAPQPQPPAPQPQPPAPEPPKPPEPCLPGAVCP